LEAVKRLSHTFAKPGSEASGVAVNLSILFLRFVLQYWRNVSHIGRLSILFLRFLYRVLEEEAARRGVKVFQSSS